MTLKQFVNSTNKYQFMQPHYMMCVGVQIDKVFILTVKQFYCNINYVYKKRKTDLFDSVL